MATLKAGDVVVADFPGITGVKRRPAVVVSTDAYHLGSNPTSYETSHCRLKLA